VCRPYHRKRGHLISSGFLPLDPYEVVTDVLFSVRLGRLFQVGCHALTNRSLGGNMHIDGACHCALITFSAEIDPTRVMACHCTDCRILSGSPFRVSVAAPMHTFVLRGQPKSFIKVAESGNRSCAALLSGVRDAAVRDGARECDFRDHSLGCVKQRAQLVPAVQVWHRSSMPWLPELHRIPGTPEQQGFLPAVPKPAV
jgi:hypothetical protein